MTTRTEAVIDRLRNEILGGAHRPGTHLQEHALAQSIGVSRTPVRDALRVLASESLLDYSPNRGYVVRAVGLGEILDAYDVRANLEAMACRLCAERGLDAAAATSIDALLAQSAALFDAGRWTSTEQAAWHGLNAGLHRALVDASGNAHLAKLTAQMRTLPRLSDPRLEPRHAFFQSVYTLERARISATEHAEIVAAIAAGQGTRAEALMREHVFRNREALRRVAEQPLDPEKEPS